MKNEINFSSVDRVVTDYVMYYNENLKMLAKAIKEDNKEMFDSLYKKCDLSVDNYFLIRLAALKANKRMFRILTNRCKDYERSSVLCCILTGNNLELLEVFGDIDTEEDLSAEVLATAICKHQNEFFLNNYCNQYANEYNLLSIAVRSENKEVFDYLMSIDYEYNVRDTLLTASTIDDKYFFETLYSKYESDVSDDDLVDLALVAVNSGSNFVLDFIDKSIVNNKDNAILKSAINSENRDAIKILGELGASFDFNDYCVLSIAMYAKEPLVILKSIIGYVGPVTSTSIETAKKVLGIVNLSADKKEEIEGFLYKMIF